MGLPAPRLAVREEGDVVAVERRLHEFRDLFENQVLIEVHTLQEGTMCITNTDSALCF